MGVYQTVLVGTDGSPSSFLAVDRAAQLAGDGAKLVLVCAYRAATDDEVAAAEETLGDSAFKVAGANPAERVLVRAASRAARNGCAMAESVPVEGEPVPALLDEADRWGADVIVVGDRGLASVTERILGSVPGNVVRKAKVDVLVVHTSE